MTTTMRRRGAGIVGAAWLALAVLAAPSAALALQPIHEPPGQATPSVETLPDEAPADGTPSDEAPGDAPHSTPAPTDGEVVYDGPFISPTPDPTPVREVRGATGAPAITPPATDALDGDDGAPTPGAGVSLLLLVVGGLAPLILLAGRVPAARRS